MSLARIAFQACSIDHSDISLFRIKHLRAIRNRVAQEPPFTPIRFEMSCRSNRLVTHASRREAELCQTFKSSAISLRRSG